MAWSRALALKAALVAGFLLLLLNLIGPRLDVKYDKASMSLIQKAGSLQWPKRTRSSSVINLNRTLFNNNSNNLIKNNKSSNSINNNNVTVTVTPIISTTNLAISQDIILATNLTQSMNNSKINLTPIAQNNVTITYNNNNANKNTSNNSNTITQKENDFERSTKSNFIQNLMTTLGLNACPPIPPNLDGPFKVDTSAESLENVEKRFETKLLPGGWFRPLECNARDRVAIIVPYRDRKYHLPIFLKNLHPFLMKQQIEYGIFIVEQTSGSLFNRAALMNIGSVEALKLSNWDCFVFHDVDLLPLDDRNLYTCPDQPRHMSVAVDTLSFRLPYSTLFGGVSAMTVKQFQKVNGFSNSFWGWGGEDDDMSNRLKHVGFHIARYPVNIARYTMLTHKKERANPKRYETLSSGAKRIDVDGLNSLKYKLKSLRKKPLFTWILAEIQQEQAS